MKITTDPKSINYLLNKLSIISKARFVQLITNAEEQTLCFKGSNDSVQIITSSVKCEVDKTGACGFDYFVLKDLISSLRTASQIVLDCTDSQIKVTNLQSKGNYNVASISADDVIVDMKHEKNLPKVSVSIDSSALGKSLSCVLKAAPKNDARWFLNGLNFEYCSESKVNTNLGPSLILVATDGSRLNTRTIEVQKGFGVNRNFVVPNNPNNPFIDYLLRLTATYSGDITIKFSDSFAEIMTPEGDSIRTKLLEHKYVNWRRILVNGLDNFTPITFKRAELLSILNRFLTITLKFDRICNVSIEIAENGLVELAVNSRNNVVSALEQLTTLNPEHSKLSLACNTQFLIDLLTVDTLEDVTLWFHKTNPSDNIIRYDYLETSAVVMPSRI